MDRYKRSILKKNKNYRPYTVYGIGNFIFSPVTRVSGGAYVVLPSGDVGGNYYDFDNSSYGWESPATTVDDWVCYVNFYGGVVTDMIHLDVDNSYGFL